jgi:hypothetical protein
MLVVEGVWDLGFIVDLGWEGAREGGGFPVDCGGKISTAA